MIELIKQINDTHPISKTTWKRISELIEINEYEAKHKIVEIGKKTNYIYFIFSGIVRAYTIFNKKEYNNFLLNDNNYFAAFPALISQEPSSMGIECLTNCKIASCNYSEILKLTENSIELNILYRKIFENFIISMDNREIELISLWASDRYLALKKRIPNIDNLISQKHIAAHLGITTVQLSRLKRELISPKKK
jgi:CRP-like cAMP-binding protein